jgi:hypothetical protein
MPARRPAKQSPKAAPKAAPRATSKPAARTGKPDPKPDVTREGRAGKRGAAMPTDVLEQSGGLRVPGAGTMTGRPWQPNRTPPPVELDVGEDDPATPPIAPVAPVPHKWRKKR